MICPLALESLAANPSKMFEFSSGDMSGERSPEAVAWSSVGERANVAPMTTAAADIAVVFGALARQVRTLDYVPE